MGRYILAATLSSNIGIYGPAFELMEHEPFPGKEEYNHNEKYEIKHWDWDRPGNLKNDIARVNRIRHARIPALRRTSPHIRFVDSDNPRVLAYLKQTGDRQRPASGGGQF
jgi:starch synthase (maltosyl-transferring)